MLKEQRLKMLLLKKDLNNHDAYYKMHHRPVSTRTTSETNKTLISSHISNDAYLKLIQNKLFYSIIQQSLWMKYNVTPEKYNNIIFDNVIQSKYCRTLALFKEELLFCYDEEFLRRYYKRSESKTRIPKFVDYYKNYLNYFCNPVFCEIDLNEVIQVHGERLARLYYSNNMKSSEKDKKSEHKNNKTKKVNDKENIIFNSTVKDLLSTTSLTCIHYCPTEGFANNNDKELLFAKRQNLFEDKNSFEKTMPEILQELIANKETVQLTLKPQTKKIFLLNKTNNNQITEINDNKNNDNEENVKITSKYSINKPSKKESFQDKVCYTEDNNKHQDQGIISRNHITNRDTFMTHVNHKTDVFSTTHRKPFIINKDKILTKVKLKLAQPNPIHVKNTLSIQLDKQKGGTQNNYKISSQKKENTKNDSQFSKPKMIVPHTEGNQATITLAKSSRNNLNTRGKGLYSIATESNMPKPKVQIEDIKLPFFTQKSKTIARAKSKKKQ